MALGLELPGFWTFTLVLSTSTMPAAHKGELVQGLETVN